jgi:hypothetical protein
MVAQGETRGGCIHKRKYIRLAFAPIPGLWTPVIHHNCVGNQIIGVTNRVLGAVPQPTKSAIALLMKYAISLGKRLPNVLPEELGRFALEYNGAKRLKYLAAAEEVKKFGIRPKDANITMFIKPDRINPNEKRNPDPRAIQFRDPRYCVAIAAYLKPIEPHLYALKYDHHLLGDTRLIAKGLNQVDRARILRKKWKRFALPYAFSIDASRFDKHVHDVLLRAEHTVYLQCNSDQQFRDLLEMQLLNRGFSKEGVQYITRGKRMSGDMNTALGNCIIMILMVLATFIPLNRPFDVFDDGDDCLIICESTDVSLFRTATLSMIQFGMVIKIENEASNFENIVFCQSQPIKTALGWKFTRNPTKVMSCTLVGNKWLHLNRKGRATFLNGLAECEIILNKGVPVLHAFAQALRRNAATDKIAFDATSGEHYRYMRELKTRINVNTIVPITLEARLSYHRAFNCSPEQQVHYASACRSVTKAESRSVLVD